MKKILLILTFIFALTIPSYFLLKINVTNVISTYIPPELDSYKMLLKSEKIFVREDNLILMFSAKDGELVEFIQRLAKFKTYLASLEKTDRIFSPFNYEEISGSEDGLSINPIIDENNITRDEIEKAKQRVIKDRFITDLIISKDFKHFTLIIVPKEINNGFKRYEYENKIFHKLDTLGLNKNLKGYGGDFAVDLMQFHESLTIMNYIIPAIIIFGFILLYIMYRSWVAVVLSAMTMMMTNSITMGVFSALGFDYNLFASVIPTLMMALNTAFAIHLYSAFQTEQIHHDFKTALKKAVEEVRRPSFYSALTTAIGMGSLSFSDLPSMRAVGVVACGGTMLLYFLVLYYIPNLLDTFCSKKWKVPVEGSSFNKYISQIINLNEKHPGKIILFFVSFLIICSILIFKVEAESNVYKFFAEDHELNQSKDLIKKNFSGVTTVNLILEDLDSKLYFVSPELHQKLDQLKKDILNIDKVTRVFGPTDIIKQFHWAFHAEDEKYYAVPETKELIEQYLFIYDGTDLYDFLSRDFHTIKFTINLSVEGANAIQDVVAEIHEFISKEHFPKNIRLTLSGYGKVFSDQEDIVVNDLYKSLYLSLTLIFLVVLVIWRNIWLGILGMIPNIAPILVMFGIMGLCGIFLDIGTAMIASVTLGIAIDDTIHIVTGIRKRIKEGLSPKEAVSKTIYSSGRAVIITTLILSSQFLAMLFSEFMPLMYFGVLTFVGMVSALIFDLFFLPALIIKYADRKKLGGD